MLLLKIVFYLLKISNKLKISIQLFDYNSYLFKILLYNNKLILYNNKLYNKFFKI